MHNKLHITRYNKTRNWAIWANEELLAVTVYRKGAQAVLDYIYTLTQNTINTMSKTKTTAAATTATNNADFDPTIIKAVNGEGKTIRIKFDPLGVSVCHNLKGKWCAHEIYNQPLPELIAEGVFTIEDEDSQKTYAKYFNAGKKDKRSKAKRSKAKKQKKNAEPQEQEQEAAIATIEEAPQMEAAEINEEVEAALWQEIEEAREAEQLAEVTMEAQDEEAAEADEESAEPAVEEPESNEPESNKPVTELEPTAEAPAQESAAEAAQPEEAPSKLSTYNLKKAGQAPMSLTPGSDDIKLEPGDQLIRIYKRRMIEVEVTENGYKWNGEVYPTLTHISWKAAGYQISGNTFFGLPSKPRNKA